MSLDIKNISHAHIFDAGKYYGNPGLSTAFHRPIRVKVRDADGSEREITRIEKLPPMPNMKYVNAAGHVVRLTLTQSSGQTNTDGEYALRKRHWMELYPAEVRVPDGHGGTRVERRGGIEYGRCPLLSESGQRWISDEIRKTSSPCDPRDFGRGRKYGDHCGCPHIEMVIAERMGQTAEYQRLQEEERKSVAQRQVEEDSKRNKAIVEQLSRTAAAAQAPVDVTSLLHQLASNPDIMRTLNAIARGADAGESAQAQRRRGKPTEE